MRKLLNRGFKPKNVLDWERRIQELVGQCIAELDLGGSFDLVSQLALPLPTIVIAEMLGAHGVGHPLQLALRQKPETIRRLKTLKDRRVR